MTAPIVTSIRSLHQRRVEITFDQPMLRDGSFYNPLHYGFAPAVPVAQILSPSVDKALVVLDADLQEGTEYTGVVALALRNLAGETLDPAQNSQVFEATIDDDSPTVLSVQALDENRIEVLYSETLDPASAVSPENYDIQSRVTGQPVLIGGGILSGGNKVELLLNTRQSDEGLHELLIEGVKDEAGNQIASSLHTYIGQSPGHSLIGVEFDADERKLTLTFDAPLIPQTVRSLSAFQIAPVAVGVAEVYIAQAKPGARPEVVELDVSEMTDGASYQIDVSPSVWDLWGNTPEVDNLSFTGKAKAPLLRSAVARSRNLLALMFSKPMLLSEAALDPSSYSISPAGTVVQVVEVSDSSVLLGTTDLIPGFPYEVSLNEALTDIGHNPISLPATVAFNGYGGLSIVDEFPIRLYDLILGGIRTLDQEQGGFFLKRFLEPLQLAVERCFERLLEAPKLRDARTCPAKMLPILALDLGWPKDLLNIFEAQPIPRQREIVLQLPALWKRKGGQGAIAQAIQAVFGVVALEMDGLDDGFVVAGSIVGSMEQETSIVLSELPSRIIDLYLFDSKQTIDRNQVRQIVQRWRPLGQIVHIHYASILRRFGSLPKSLTESSIEETYEVPGVLAPQMLLLANVGGSGVFGIRLGEGADQLTIELDPVDRQLRVIHQSTTLSEVPADIAENTGHALCVFLSRVEATGETRVEVTLDGYPLVDLTLPNFEMVGPLELFHLAGGEAFAESFFVLPLPAQTDVVELNHGYVGQTLAV